LYHDRIGLEGASKNETPAEYGALPEDPDGMDCQEEFNYPSGLGMIGIPTPYADGDLVCGESMWEVFVKDQTFGGGGFEANREISGWHQGRWSDS
jgi:hypothetical protein